MIELGETYLNPQTGEFFIGITDYLVLCKSGLVPMTNTAVLVPNQIPLVDLVKAWGIEMEEFRAKHDQILKNFITSEKPVQGQRLNGEFDWEFFRTIRGLHKLLER